MNWVNSDALDLLIMFFFYWLIAAICSLSLLYFLLTLSCNSYLMLSALSKANCPFDLKIPISRL